MRTPCARRLSLGLHRWHAGFVVGSEACISVASRSYTTCEGLSYLPLDLPSYRQQAGRANLFEPHQCATPVDIAEVAGSQYSSLARTDRRLEPEDEPNNVTIDLTASERLSEAKTLELRRMFDGLDLDRDGRVTIADAEQIAPRRVGGGGASPAPASGQASSQASSQASGTETGTETSGTDASHGSPSQDSLGGATAESARTARMKAALAARLDAVREEILSMVDGNPHSTVSFEEFVGRLVRWSADFG